MGNKKYLVKFQGHQDNGNYTEVRQEIITIENYNELSKDIIKIQLEIYFSPNRENKEIYIMNITPL